MAGRWSISIWKPTRTTAPSSFLITAGGQLEFEKAINLKPFPIAFGFKVRGGVTVDFQAAVRYAEQLGLEWNDETACAVNDYLTALRINAFIDVASSDYFFQAVLWAVEQGITTGTGSTTFSPDMACTRAQIVTFLYRCLN